MKYWKISAVLIIVFMIGYLMNIMGICLNWEGLNLTFGTIVYLFGALFVVGVFEISYVTYKLIIKIANNEETEVQ
ncbi:MAG: hypothetical protein ACTSRC_13975 [Candidatus Helarchaeota archaeon]